MGCVRWHVWKKVPGGETTLPQAGSAPRSCATSPGLGPFWTRRKGLQILLCVPGTLPRLSCVFQTSLQFSRGTQRAETCIPHSRPSQSRTNLPFHHQPLLPNAKPSPFSSFLPSLQHALLLRRCSEAGASAHQAAPNQFRMFCSRLFVSAFHSCFFASTV